MMFLVGVCGCVLCLLYSLFAEVMVRCNARGLVGFGAGFLIILAGYNYDASLMGVSAFWLILAVAFFFADGGFAILGPYAAEVWPSHLRTSGLGSAFGFRGIDSIHDPVRHAALRGCTHLL